MGRLIKKHHRQEAELAIAPPTRGPDAAAIDQVAPTQDVHFARSLLVSRHRSGHGPKRSYV